MEGAGREGSGEEASVRPEEDRAGGWKGRAGGPEAEGARKPARPLPAQPLQHPGQTPTGQRRAAPRRARRNFSGLGRRRDAGLLRSGAPPRRALQGSPFGETRLRAPRLLCPAPRPW